MKGGIYAQRPCRFSAKEKYDLVADWFDHRRFIDLVVGRLARNPVSEATDWERANRRGAARRLPEQIYEN